MNLMLHRGPDSGQSQRMLNMSDYRTLIQLLAVNILAHMNQRLREAYRIGRLRHPSVRGRPVNTFKRLL